MSLEKVLSMGERLQKILDDAEEEANHLVAEAERKANEMISKAKTDATRRNTMAQRGSGIDELLREAEDKAKIEAEKSLDSYGQKVEALKEIPEEKMEEAVVKVLKEVLPK